MKSRAGSSVRRTALSCARGGFSRPHKGPRARTRAVCVNLIAPGFVDTPLSAALLGGPPRTNVSGLAPHDTCRSSVVVGLRRRRLPRRPPHERTPPSRELPSISTAASSWSKPGCREALIQAEAGFRDWLRCRSECADSKLVVGRQESRRQTHEIGLVFRCQTQARVGQIARSKLQWALMLRDAR